MVVEVNFPIVAWIHLVPFVLKKKIMFGLS